MSKAPRHRRPLIEALEPRLLFSATADIAVFDDGNSDVQYLARAAQEVDLVSIYMPDEPAPAETLLMQDSPADNSQIDTVVFVDTAVDDYQSLVSDIENAATAQTVAIVYLDSTQDGLAQISEYLDGATGISAVHIISHGVAGSVQLGAVVLNENNIAQHQQSLGNWKNALREDADILLYGCDVAANQSGINLMRQLSDLTGADVAASNDLTGNTRNADWDLEEQVGRIETASIFSSDQSQLWKGVLADVVHLYSGTATNEQAIPAAGYVMQGVQLTSSQTVDRIQVMLANHGTSSATVQMIVHQHSYNGTPVATATINTSSLGNSLGWVNFDFAQTTFNAYTVYWIEFKTNNGADNLVGIGYINSNVISSEFVVNGSGDGNKDMAIALVDVENRAPTVPNPIANQTATEEALFSYTFAANTFNDQDGDTLTYTATRGDGAPLPAWLNFNAATRTFSGVPDDGDVGTLSVRLMASDGKGGTVSDTFDIVVNNINDNPFLNVPVSNQSATEDSVFNYTFPANTFGDGDVGTSFTYTATLPDGSALPAWFNFDSATRTFSGTPLNADVGTLSIKLTSNDGAGGTASDTFDIVIANTNDTPVVVNPIANQNATENSLFNFSFPSNAFGDPDAGDSLTYSAQLAGALPLPGWLTFEAATRTFSGTPSNGDVGSITVRVTATDVDGSFVTNDFAISVQNVGSTNSVIDTSGPSIHTQILTPQRIYQSFTNDFNNGTYTIDSIVLQLQKSPSASVQTITVTLLEGAYNGTIVDTATISSNDLSTSLTWEAFDFTNNVLTDSTVYYIAVETTSNDGLVVVGIHNTNAYPDGTLVYSSGTPDNDRDLAFQVASGNNTDPVLVNPIPNQNATEDAAFNFQFASGTFNDADAGDTLTYTATLGNGNALPTWLTFNSATRTFSGTPTNADVGTLSIRVTASDGHGGSSPSDTFDLIIANANDAPTVANPIPNQNAIEDAAFNFTFPANTFADPDTGSSLSYSAQLGGGGALPAWLSFDSATRTFSGTPTNTFVGTVAIDVIANDGNGGTVTDTFNIVVANTNDAPIIANAIPNQNATEDSAFNFQFASNTFSDPDTSDSFTYSAQLAGGGALPGWLNFNAATRTFSGTPSNGDVGTFSIDVIASDSNGGTVTDTFSITVANVNDAPSVNIALTDYYKDEQVAVNLHGTGISISEVDSTNITLTLTGAGGNSQLTANVGTTGVTIFSGNASATLVLTGTLTQLNDFLAGNNGGTLTYRMAGNTPIASTTLTITASDGALTGSDTATINVTAINDAPLNTVPGAQVTNEDTALVFSATNSNQIQIGDVDVAAGTMEVTLSVTNGTLTLAGTTGLSFTTGDGAADSILVFTGTLANINSALSTLTFTPTSNYAGAAVLSLTTSDLGNNGSGGTLTDTDTVNITINNTNDIPTIANAIPDQNATEDSAFNFQFAANTFTDADAGTVFTYTAQLAGGGVLPAWLNFDAATRTFSGTPVNGDVGSISIDVIANDGSGAIVTDTFNIIIANANDAPTIANAIPDQNATEDSAFNFQFAANTFADADAGTVFTYTAQLAGGGVLPAWLNFDAATRTFSGTPANGDVGSISIDVIANDGSGGTITDTFNIVIMNSNDAPTIANAILDQNATEDSAFNFQFAANTFADPDAGTVFTYTAQLAGGGALPTWLNFDAATRTFSGTPANGDVGSISIDVIANDGSGGTITDTFNIVITNSNDAPTVNSPPVNLIAREDEPFNFSFPLSTFNDVDAGDSLTYSVQLANGQALPAWLQFNGTTLTLTGTPLSSDAGILNIQLIANDGETTANFQFTLEVIQVNDAPVAIAPSVINNLEDSSGNQLDLFAIFSDQETAANQLQYSIVSNSNPGLVTGASINTSNGQLTFSYGANQFGSSDLILRAQDANGAFVETPVRINISPVNDAPISSGIADMRADAGSAPLQLDLHRIFSDIEDGTALTYTIVGNTNPAVATNIQWDQSTGAMTIAVAGATGGETFITLRAQDSNGDWVDTQFKLTVTAPVIIPEQPSVPPTPVTPPSVTEVPVTPPTVLPTIPPTDNHNPGTGNNGIDSSVPDNNLNVPVQGVPPFEQGDPRDNFNLPNDKSSRDYARIEAELESKNVPAITLTASSSLVGLINTDAGFAPWEAADFDNEVRRIRAQMDVAMDEEQDRRAVIAGLTFSVTTGLLIWSLRASSLLLTLVSMLPLWRGLDPLPILDEVNKRKKELEQQRKDRAREDKSSKEVGYLFDHAQQKQSRR